MPHTIDRTALSALRQDALPLAGSPADIAAVLQQVGDARIVLIGEASHGTHDFYRMRAEITKRLITEKGFAGVAVEADWPDAYRVNRYVRGDDTDRDAVEALSGFLRFPQWMWRNADVLDFVGWLRAHNDDTGRHSGRMAGFYGLDLYSLHASIDAVLRYLDIVDRAAAARARARYTCFDRFGEDLQEYGYAASIGWTPTCEREVLAQLIELRRATPRYASLDHRVAADDAFFAEQNAFLVANAERYYRAMFGSQAASWNVRDEHMTATLDALLTFLADDHGTAKIVVWAHNSHLGDARATERTRAGELNVGQLVRERHGAECFLLGFSTWSGTVTAAPAWDEPAELMRVRPALAESFEALFHEMNIPDFLLPLRGDVPAILNHPRLQRAIGVIYRPDTERQSHYFHARLPAQFDAMLHIDVTRAVEPLERSPAWASGEPPETYPSAL
jgi:erythromycin esterase-like protein